MRSNLLRDISLFRYDSQTKRFFAGELFLRKETSEIYILAKDNIQVTIPPSGKWEFIDE